MQLVDTLQELAVEKQSLLTRLELLRQAEEYGVAYDEEEPFWQSEAFLAEEDEELLLPTDTPTGQSGGKAIVSGVSASFSPGYGRNGR